MLLASLSLIATSLGQGAQQSTSLTSGQTYHSLESSPLRPLPSSLMTILFTNGTPSWRLLLHSNPGTLILGSSSMCFLFRPEDWMKLIQGQEQGEHTEFQAL
ncbi:hypothetical protein Tco_0926791 [Tanacetum coccineum]|uniref:Secreted protein n=1 Tax=Tanacetum coccineum TaxID=301880 RepID=A0ABQ5DBL9_9ASTR